MESLTCIRILAITLGCSYIVTTVRPGFQLIGNGSISALGTAFGYATAHTRTRILVQVDSRLCIPYVITVLQLLMAFFPALFEWVWRESTVLHLLYFVSVSAMSAHYTLICALKLAEASIVVPMEL